MNGTVDTQVVPTLTAQDRCDRCSAKAVVATVMFGGSSLIWCGHHFAEFSSALQASGARVVVDEREL